MSTTVIILAAGKGTRMRSSLPKVLQPLAGRPLLGHVIETAKKLNADNIITIYGHGGDRVQAAFAEQEIKWVEQAEQLGTGHAVQMTLPVLPQDGVSLILSGDVPCINPVTLQKLLDATAETGIGLVSLTLPDANGYGRIVREQGQIQAIVEHKDASEEQRQIKEINTGIYAVSNAKLHQWLPRLSNDNAQGEYYLTDIIGMLVSAGKVVSAFAAPSYAETLGVNSRQQMAEAERVLRQRKLDELMTDGVSIIDPNNTYVDTTVTVGRDTVLYPGTILEGDTVIGGGCQVGPYVRMTNVKMGDDDHVQFMYAHDCEIKNGCEIGPFVHFRPNTVIGNQVKVGNYMEVKNSTVGDGTKLPHLSYIGDSDVGSGVNIGCGTITVNYDGKIKHRTTIGDHAFVGCNSNLVAPVKVGDYAYVGAGSTITKDIPAKALSVARARQRNIEGWVKEDTYKK